MFLSKSVTPSYWFQGGFVVANFHTMHPRFQISRARLQSWEFHITWATNAKRELTSTIKKHVIYKEIMLKWELFWPQLPSSKWFPWLVVDMTAQLYAKHKWNMLEKQTCHNHMLFYQLSQKLKLLRNVNLFI